MASSGLVVQSMRLSFHARYARAIVIGTKLFRFDRNMTTADVPNYVCGPSTMCADLPAEWRIPDRENLARYRAHVALAYPAYLSHLYQPDPDMLRKFMATDVFQSTNLDDAVGDLAFRTKTHRPRLTRSGSQASNSNSTSIRALEKCPMIPSELDMTFAEDAEGDTVADITWEGDNVVLIPILVGDECIKGTAELFGVASMRISRSMEYTVGIRLSHAAGAGSSLIPASVPRAGHDCVDLRALPHDEILEMLAMLLAFTPASTALNDASEQQFAGMVVIIKSQAYSHTRNQRTTQQQPLWSPPSEVHISRLSQTPIKQGVLILAILVPQRAVALS
ncbi:uncharacterized protein LAESUDRAFT_794313 [Laetiporus sulphureus 93-53]|uniref:Uncharacterized protein n=1 Tax=Laetiporus sulphureus 93-53 TaxID=1314785 RepID=A0A165C3I7_9APHY|nr:uncharacterized protein LAESUDRAFT_794313 [Laetiporus sulphureus 93-53]KZT02141.1 hypothetical protein LAESUDRAFT_794313 [Laetiporus sulphureus 93-53]